MVVRLKELCHLPEAGVHCIVLHCLDATDFKVIVMLHDQLSEADIMMRW